MGLFDRLFQPNRGRFARKLRAIVLEADPSLRVEVDESNFRLIITDDDGEPMISNLHNVYQEHCQIPREDRDKHLRQIARATLSYKKDIPDEFGDARYDILPCIRTGFYLEHVQMLSRLRDADPPADIPRQAIGEQLAVYLVYDLPESMRSISRQNLDDWGVTFYEAMETAMENLRQRDLTIAGIEDSLYMPAEADPYNPSFLLDLDFVQNLDVRGRPIAVVPNANHFILTGSEDEEGLEMMLTLTKQAFEEPRPLSAIPMELVDDHWRIWSPPKGHPLAEEFEQLEIQSLHEDYAAQKELLDALNEKSGEDVFVATYATVSSKKRLKNYSVWSEGVDTLLPKSQFVFLVRETADGKDSEIVASAPWRRIHEVVGRLMTPVDTTPPRFRVSEFPTAEELEEIGRVEF